jgi:DNA polymerase IV
MAGPDAADELTQDVFVRAWQKLALFRGGEVAAWLQKRVITARTVTLKMRYDDFTTITRSHSTPQMTGDPDAIATRALALLAKTEAGARPVRLLGVGVHNLSTDEEGEAAESPELRLPFS